MKGLLLGMLMLSMTMSGTGQTSFKNRQLSFERVKLAYKEKWQGLQQDLKTAGINSQFQLFLAAYKYEGRLEVWIKGADQSKAWLFKVYTFCQHSGLLGPKLKEGDLQTPEGVYHLTAYNPQSRFHLSLGINYPNATDLLRSGKEKPGNEIYIHGDCVTVGCIPITDDKIRELYVLAIEAREHGQTQIPVYIFPFKMTGANIEKHFPRYPQHVAFWQKLKPVYDRFDKSREIP